MWRHRLDFGVYLELLCAAQTCNREIFPGMFNIVQPDHIRVMKPQEELCVAHLIDFLLQHNRHSRNIYSVSQ